MLCEICDKQFAQKRTFNEHMAAHPENQLYNCKECDMWFAIESEWKEHITDCYKKLKCGVCNKSFKYYSWLCQHEKTHEYKPYECDIQCARMALMTYENADIFVIQITRIPLHVFVYLSTHHLSRPERQLHWVALSTN